MRQLLIIAIALSIAAFSCKNKKSNYTDTKSNSNNYSSTENDTEEESGYSDGDYCATVNYYNPNTGTSSSYTLTVEVEDGELTQIHWPNGGWLDDSHFTPEELDEDGAVSFTSDKGYEYEVQIDSKGPCNYVSNNAVTAEQSERTQIEGEEGTVIWDHYGCNYIIIETSIWYVVADKSYGAYSLNIGSRVRGDLIGFGFEDVYDISADDEVRLYLDNYYGSKSSALEKVMEKCDLIQEEE